MPVDIAPFSAADRDSLQRLITHPSLSREFELLQGTGGLDHMLEDPFCPESTRHMARDGGAAVGLGFAFVVGSGPERWAMIRVGVVDSHRRRGIGRALTEAVTERLKAAGPGLGEWCMSAWEPCDGARALAASLGYRETRRFWMMERPFTDVAAPPWPAGVQVRTFDGSSQAVSDVNAAYNDAFSEHYHFFPTTDEETARLVRLPRFEAEGLALAYRDGVCVGYCRCERMPARGELASLGVVHSARGIGLGRALLRWGTQWLKDRGVPVISLVVDGDNEGARRLYRSEGYEVSRTRLIWSRPPSA